MSRGEPEKKNGLLSKDYTFRLNKKAQERIGCRFTAPTADRVTRVS